MTLPGPTPAAPVVETPTATPPTPAATSPATTVPEPAKAPETAPKRSLEDSLATLDQDTREFVLGEVQKARREAGDSRANAKKQAAEDARSELAQAIGKAIGLVEDEKVDPAQLTDQLAAQTTAARQAQIELAVYRAAGAVAADPAALLDSRTFLTSVAAVDPGDSAAITAAIEAAKAANPALGVAPTRRTPAPTVAVGSSANGAPGIDDQIAAAKKAGDVKTWMHLENQKLAAPGR